MKTSFHWFLAGSLAFLASSPALHAGPVNDLFANRIVLTGTNITVNGNNAGAGEEPGEDIGPQTTILWVHTVWYTWTAPTNGVVHISGETSVYDFYMSIRVYRGSAVDALTLAPTTPAGNVPVTPGDTLQIQVASIHYPIWGGGYGSGPFTLTLWLEVPGQTSLNDAFANRFEITTPLYHFEGSIYGATNEPGEPLPSANAAQTLWWSFPSSSGGVLNLLPYAPDFTPTMTVYDGTDFASMSPVPPASGTLYRLEAGHEYSVQMATAYVPSGGFRLDTRFYAASNDMFAGSEHLEGSNVTYYGNVAWATFEAGEPPGPASNTVWAAWAAPGTGRVNFTLGNPGFFANCEIFTGPSLAQLQPVPAFGLVNSWYSFLAIEGTVYYFRFSGDGATFTFSLVLYPLGECTNDNFADAEEVKGQVVYFEAKSVIGATMELGEPAHLGAVPQKSIWWKWQAPVFGTAYLDSQSSIINNVLLAVYSGKAVEALKLVGKGTRYFNFPVKGGETYYIAGAVPTNTVGDILNYLQYSRQDSSVHLVPGNVLQEPSWEGTALEGAQYWHWTGPLGGWVNEMGGVDGTTWPELGSGTTIWQDFPSVPGHAYTIRFAYSSGDGARVRVAWDTNLVGFADVGAGESLFWHWGNFSAVASNSVTRISFQAIGQNVAMDAFSVVDASAAPAIVTQPASISTVGGGAAAFIVGATGSEPLSYQWYFNDAPLDWGTNRVLIWDAVSTNQTGSYFVLITNVFGSVTSSPAFLFVDAPVYPTIVWEPYGDTVGAGGYYRFSVAAVGSLPLTYQWFFNGAPMPEATNNTLTLTDIQTTNAGAYVVTVQNGAGTVWSLPANLRVGETNQGGGVISFRNSFYFDGTNVSAPVLDVDGVTALSGGTFVAQLYAGPALEWLRPAGQPTPFRTGFGAGYFVSQLVTLANVAPGGDCVAQVRVWDATKANSYEEARALGGRFGKSDLLAITAGGDDLLPAYLVGLRSFSLQAGLPRFTSGAIAFRQRLPGAVVVWSLTGEAGYRYLVEKAAEDFVWRPYVVVTNVTGSVTFTDSANSGSAVTFYRSRILD